MFGNFSRRGLESQQPVFHSDEKTIRKIDRSSED